jgi:HEAT repeat protein
MVQRQRKWSIQKLIGGKPDTAGTLAGSDDEDARLRAARDMGKHGDERATGPLIEAMVTEHGPVAAAAADALVSLDKRGHEISPEVLLDLIDRIQWEQLRGTYPYGTMGSRSYVPTEVIWSLIDLLRRRATAEHIPALTEALRRFPRSSKRTYIVTYALCGLDDPAGFKALAGHLRHTFDAAETREILNALCPGRASTTSGELIRPSARPGQAEVLLELFTDASLLVPDRTTTLPGHEFDAVPIRARIAEALGMLGERRAVQPLLTWFDEIRAALANLEPPVRNADGYLVFNAAENAYKNARQALTTSLGLIGGPEVIEAMLARLDDEVAVEILGDCGDSSAVPALITCLQEKGSRRRAAADALGKLGDARAVPALCALLRKVDRDKYADSLQPVLAKALARIGDRSALPALQAIDPGPVTKEDYADARMWDDAIYYSVLEVRDEIHQAVAALKARKG